MNPYLEEYNKAKQQKVLIRSLIRNKLTKRYSWAVPNDEALDVIRKYAPIIEIGAGKGYWASLLQCDIVCYDASSGLKNHYTDNGESYYPVGKGDPSTIKEHPDRTLFLCWPPYDEPMAGDCLSEYEGEYFIYVGEGYGGCCGDSDFWEQIERNWEEVGVVYIPQWWGMHDRLEVYKRK